MTIFASGQQTLAAAPNYAYPGDVYNAPGLPGTSTTGTGMLAASAVLVNTFAWVVEGDTGLYLGTAVTQAKGSNSRPVFIARQNASVYSNADINQGWSMTIPLGYQTEVWANGSFYSTITLSANVGNAINIGDAIFVNDVTGTLAVGITTEPGYTQTDYVVINNNVPDTFGLNVVVISNVQAI